MATRTGTAPAGPAALASAVGLVVAGAPLRRALEALAEAAVADCDADAGVIRTGEPGGSSLTARAVAGASAAVAAELLGTSVQVAELEGRAELPAAVAAAARRLGAEAALVLPVVAGERAAGTLELYRAARDFTPAEAVLAELAARQVALALRLCDAADGAARSARRLPLELAGEALAAAAEEGRSADRVARLAARLTEAEAAWVWRSEGERCELLGASPPGLEPGDWAREAAARLVGSREAVAVDRGADGTVLASLQLGEPPLGALQLAFRGGVEPGEEELEQLASFAVRAAHALRASERTLRLGAEVERSRALLDVVGQAIAELSLKPTLETVVRRIAELLAVPRVAVYLRDEDGRLEVAEQVGLEGPHAEVAAALLELARGSGIVWVGDAVEDPRLARVAEAAAEAGLESAVALPLVAHVDTIGVLALYPLAARQPTENETALLHALAAQLAVAFQNARLHERTATLAAEREQALASERAAARRLEALYEVSRSFAQSLSLERTLDAVAKTVALALDVDAAAIRLPDERGAELQVRALHVVEPRLEKVAEAVLSRPQPLASPRLRALLRRGEPLVLTAGMVGELGGAYALLEPFLAKGATAAVIPIATPTEVLGTISIVSFEPARPIDEERVATALSIAGQAALAIDNARLYQQQKAFADAMQRSLLPRAKPSLPGLELGDVYESAARVEVGGDVYDYMALPDGRLAVVLGDVTGHGVDATADMAMAKFVFRSLAREHPHPAALLAHANTVVCSEIAPGKFITMAALAVDAAAGTVVAASAGHPPPRLVRPDGAVEGLPVRGLALGIDEETAYEPVEIVFPPGAAVVLVTDGAIEARREGELFGVERLDRVLAEHRDEPAQAMADAVVAACRAWAGRELADDLAVVVIKRAA
jgi:serine phosphatase RsbU (regulator of sigma subunit)